MLRRKGRKKGLSTENDPHFVFTCNRMHEISSMRGLFIENDQHSLSCVAEYNKCLTKKVFL